MKIYSGFRSSLTHVARRGRSQQRWRRKLKKIRDWDRARNRFGRQPTFCYRVNLYILCTHKAQIGYGLLGKEHITSVVLINRWLVWTNNGINRTRKHYSALKLNGLLVHGTSWMNHKGIMPTKRSLTDKCVLYAFSDMTFQKRQTHRENTRDCPVKVEGGDWLQRGMRELLEAHENVLKWLLGLGWWHGKGQKNIAEKFILSVGYSSVVLRNRKSHLPRLWFEQMVQISFLCSLEDQLGVGKHKTAEGWEYPTSWALVLKYLQKILN